MRPARRATQGSTLALALVLGAAGLGPGTAHAQQADMAEAMWAAGQRRQALALMEADLAARSDDESLRRRLARRQTEVQQFLAALATLAPLGDEVDDERGRALYMLARYDEALDLLQGTTPDSLLMRIDALLALGRLDDVGRALQAAADVLPDSDGRLRSLRGRHALLDGRPEQAVVEFRAAQAADPLDRQALHGLGQALLRTGAREEALAVLARHRELVPLLDERDAALAALLLDPAHASNHAALGDVERALARLDEAAACYERALALAAPAETAPIALRHARLLAEDRGDRAAAIGLLLAADARVPDVRLLVRAGDLALEAGDAESAATHFRAALARRPADAQIQERLLNAELTIVRDTVGTDCEF